MFRVLQIVNIMDRAGLETMLMNYYRNIDKNKVQFDFLTHRHNSGSYDDEIRSLGGKVYKAPRIYPQNYPKYKRFMKEFFAKHPEYKIVHSHIDTMSAFPIIAAKRADVPIRIAHSHSTEIPLDKKLPIKLCAKHLCPKAANVYCACGKEAGRFMFASSDFKIIHNAIDLQKFAFNEEARKEVRKKLGIENSLVVGHVGRYLKVKNQSFLLDVFSIICKKRNNAKLLLIGKGEEEENLRAKAKALNLEKDVIFLKDRSDVDKLYNAIDVFVMPSLYEGLPVVGIEAQANGIPCLFSSGIPEEVRMCNNAEAMDLSKNAYLWASKILNMAGEKRADNTETLRNCGYDVKVEADKLLHFYENLLNEHLL